MNLLARAHGLQERIRPIMYLVSRGRLGNVRTVEGECGPTTRGREVLPVPNHYGIAPASFHLEKGVQRPLKGDLKL